MTWNNNREGSELLWERLDRGFTNNHWIINHDAAQLINLSVFHSDHGAMILSTRTKSTFFKRPYRFEAMWITHPGCEETINSSWSSEVSGSPSFRLIQKLQIIRSELKKWNKATFENLMHMRRILEHNLTLAQQNLDYNNCVIKKEMREELELLAEQEQIMWMQKSRVNWLIQGDRNTKFYHIVTSRKRLRNRILGIWNEQGIWIQDQKDIAESFRIHFRKIYIERESVHIKQLRN